VKRASGNPFLSIIGFALPRSGRLETAVSKAGGLESALLDATFSAERSLRLRLFWASRVARFALGAAASLAPSGLEGVCDFSNSTFFLQRPSRANNAADLSACICLHVAGMPEELAQCLPKASHWRA
jgi:hypothetical protein